MIKHGAVFWAELPQSCGTGRDWIGLEKVAGRKWFCSGPGHADRTATGEGGIIFNADLPDTRVEPRQVQDPDMILVNRDFRFGLAYWPMTLRTWCARVIRMLPFVPLQ